MCVKSPRRWVLASAWPEARMQIRHCDPGPFSVSPLPDSAFHSSTCTLHSLVSSVLPCQLFLPLSKDANPELGNPEKRATSPLFRSALFSPKGLWLALRGHVSPALDQSLSEMWYHDWLGWLTYLSLRQRTLSYLMDNSRQILWNWEGEEFIKVKKFQVTKSTRGPLSRKVTVYFLRCYD